MNRYRGIPVTVRPGDLVVGVFHGYSDRRGNGVRQWIVQGDHKLGIILGNIALADVQQFAIVLFGKIVPEPFPVKPARVCDIVRLSLYLYVGVMHVEYL